MRVADLPTPALIVDLDVVAANLRRGQAYAEAQGVDLRPHAKTHKGPRFAGEQVAAGAAGVCVAKLGEAELMADAGIADLAMPNTVIGADKAARAVALAQRVRFAIGVDHPAQVDALAAAAAGATRPLEVLIEVDVGAGRGGAPVALPEADRGLFQALREKRMEIARAQNVPPYVIFHDRTLMELAAARPASRAQMSMVPGVGETKLDRYGPAFLSVIAEHAAGGG